MLSQAVRSWMVARGTAALAIVAFAVGIGAATSMYTVVRCVLLKPLPYAEGDRWLALYGGRTTEPRQFSSSTFSDLQEYQARTSSVDVFGWFISSTRSLTSPGEPRHVTIVAVTPGLVPALGIAPARGHWVTDDHGAVISDRLWRQLGSDPRIVGTPLTLDGRALTVTAVMPPQFIFPIAAPGADGVVTDVWIELDPRGGGADPSAGLYLGYARLKPGASLAAASAEVKAIAADLARRDPIGHDAYTAKLENLHDVSVQEQRPALWLLFAAAMLLLAIACANVAGLLLVRSVARAKETATRVALGASAARLARQYFVEGALVSMAGAIAGLALSAALVRLALAIGPEFIPETTVVAMDWTVPVVALVLGLATSLVSTIAPLWQVRRAAPADALDAGVRLSAGARVKRLSQALVVAEIALAFALLVAGGALAMRLRALGATQPGFDPDHVITFAIDVPAAATADAARRVAFERRLTDAVAAVPGAIGSGFSNQLPLAGCCWSTTIEREGRSPGETERTSFIIASSGYFGAMHIPLVRGRLVTDADRSEMPLFVVLNQAAAARYWGRDDPVNSFGKVGGSTGTRFQVVGVVGDVKNNALGEAAVPEIYVSSAVAVANPMRFVVRSALAAEAMVPQLRAAVRAVDPTLPIHDVASMTDVVTGSLSSERVSAALSAGFALTALLMATLGIYGIVSYAVRQQTVEIGTRMAIGATSGDIVRLVVGGGLTLAAVGVVSGAAIVLTASPWLARFFDGHAFSWPALFGSTGVVGLVAARAAGVPAWRASWLPPHLALRDETPPTWAAARAEVRRAMDAIARRIPFTRAASDASARALLSGFVDAARQAGSPSEAIQHALETLCGEIGATSAMLLEQAPVDGFVCHHAYPAAARPVGAMLSDGWLIRRVSAFGPPLPITPGDLEAARRWSESQRPSAMGEIEWLASIDARMAVALRGRDGVAGVLLLGRAAGGGAYGGALRPALEGCAALLALMIENGRLTSRIVEQEKVRRDLALAAEVQRRLLPDSPPEISAAVLAAVSLPARSIGGDYFDFLDVGDRRLGIALADIAGKGISAALIMSSVRMALRVLGSEGTSLPQLAARMNRVLCQATPANSYATFFYARVDDRTRELRYVNAGHLPPMLIRSGEVQELTTGGSVIGLLEGLTYEEGGVALESGDVLVAFTDGVPEAKNPDDEEFGEARLKDLLLALAHLDANEIAARLRADLKAWIQDAPQYDDLTFIVMKVR